MGQDGSAVILAWATLDERESIIIVTVIIIIIIISYDWLTTTN